MTDCIFCKITKGEIPSHKVWESDTHLAFLTIFPNTKGFTVVIPKKHLPSNIFTLDEVDYYELLKAAKDVGNLLTKAFNVERTAMIAEGTGVDHAHIKLIPLIGTKPGEKWQGGEAKINKVFEKYEGYVSSHDGPRASDEELAKIAEMIRNANKQ